MLKETQAQESKEVATDSQNNDNAYSEREKSLIADSIKYRKRAQVSEARHEERDKEDEARKLEMMESQEKYKELASEYKNKYEKVKPYQEKFIQAEGIMREDLLNRLPENIRENYKSTDLETLSKIATDINKTQSANVSNAKAGRFGGYDSPEDLALNDKQGYKDMRKTNLMNFFKPSE